MANRRVRGRVGRRGERGGRTSTNRPMVPIAAIALLVSNFALPGASVHVDTVPVAVERAASGVDSITPAERLLRAAATVDTPTTRPRAVEVSEWYARRLTIHRYLSYSVIPLFATQYVAGRQLYDHPADAPSWARPTHRAVAATLGGVFVVNTVTGLWNLWDSRSVSEGRALRTTHALTMLAADAGFTYAGVKLSHDAKRFVAKRREHRDMALASMGLTIASGLMMRIWNDR
jgi:hypothetical protein